MIVYTARAVGSDAANQSWNPRLPGKPGTYSGVKDAGDRHAAWRNARRVRASLLAPEATRLPRSTKPTRADIEAIRRAGAKMDAMNVAMGTTAEELIADFEKARREKRASRART